MGLVYPGRHVRNEIKKQLSENIPADGWTRSGNQNVKNQESGVTNDMILHLGAPAKKAILDLLTNPGSQAPLQRCGKRHVFFWVIISLYRRLHWG